MGKGALDPLDTPMGNKNEKLGRMQEMEAWMLGGGACISIPRRWFSK